MVSSICATAPPHPPLDSPPSVHGAAFFPLSRRCDSRRLLHPYREALSSVDFWEASGTGLWPAARIQLREEAHNGKALGSPAASWSSFLSAPPFPHRGIFHFAFDAERSPPSASFDLADRTRADLDRPFRPEIGRVFVVVARWAA